MDEADIKLENLEIADAHVHLYDPGRYNYSWLKNQPAINEKYDIAEYDAATGKHRIKHYICIEAAAAKTESESEFFWLLNLSESDSRLSGIVAHADLTKGEKVKDELDRISGNPLLKGIRYALNKPYEPDPEMCLKPLFIQAVKSLAEYNLSFDLVFSPEQSQQIIEFAKKCPDVQLIINHTGKPPIKSHEKQPWLNYMRKLGELPNITCKISDVLRDSGGITAPDVISPYMYDLVECFGIKRLMFGSDFPVIDLYGSFNSQINTLFQIFSAFSVDEQKDFFCKNTEKIYRLNK